MAYNRTIVAGRLMADPEIRYEENEEPVAVFSLEITHGGKSEPINCSARGGLAKIAGEYLKKGKLVAVEGRLSVNKNLKRKNVYVDDLQIIGGAK